MKPVMEDSRATTVDPQMRLHRDLESIYDENVRHVYNYARARLGPSEGEDVTAEVFLAATAEFQRGRGERVTTPWLMAVAHNKVIDRWRRATTKRSKWRALVSATPLVEQDATERVTETPTREAVLEALDLLVPRQRAVLVMHYVDGFSGPAIARQLGITNSAVESLLARSRRAFRSHYSDPAGRT
jgi:RNA polymerase sigma-70 factor (ECF subfamily)